jgi:hypothetical protein
MTQKLRVGSQEVLSVFDTAKTNDYNIIEDAATNGSPSVTIPLDMAWEKLRVWVFVTYAANTYVTVALSCSRDGTNSGAVQTRKIEDGTATLSDLTDRKNLVVSDRDYMVEYDVRGCMTATLTLGGDNTDVANLQAVAVR